MFGLEFSPASLNRRVRGQFLRNGPVGDDEGMLSNLRAAEESTTSFRG